MVERKTAIYLSHMIHGASFHNGNALFYWDCVSMWSQGVSAKHKHKYGTSMGQTITRNTVLAALAVFFTAAQVNAAQECAATYHQMTSEGPKVSEAKITIVGETMLTTVKTEADEWAENSVYECNGSFCFGELHADGNGRAFINAYHLKSTSTLIETAMLWGAQPKDSIPGLNLYVVDVHSCQGEP